MDYKQYLRIRAQLTDYLREKLKTFDPEDPQYQELAEDLINWFNERGEDGAGIYAKLVEYSDDNILEGINAGAYDEFIEAYAEMIAGLEGTVLFRPFHELNGSYYPWRVEESSEEEFVSAWEHVYSIFQAEGADNAVFVFSPESLNSAGYDSVERILSEVKDQVDIIALDGYGPSPENQYKTLFNGLL